MRARFTVIPFQHSPVRNVDVRFIAGGLMAIRPEVNFIDPSLVELETSIARSLESETSSMTTTPKREIAFIDRGVDDLATLLAGIRPDVEPILLSNDEPAPRQMARAVQGRER